MSISVSDVKFPNFWLKIRKKTKNHKKWFKTNWLLLESPIFMLFRSYLVNLRLKNFYIFYVVKTWGWLFLWAMNGIKGWCPKNPFSTLVMMELKFFIGVDQSVMLMSAHDFKLSLNRLNSLIISTYKHPTIRYDKLTNNH